MLKPKAIALVALLSASPALADGFGVCTGSVTVAITSTQVLAENDVPGGRHLMDIQNSGTNPMYCNMDNTTDATATNGFLIQPAGSWHLESIEGVNGVYYLVPQKRVSCIAVGGTTTAVACDY